MTCSGLERLLEQRVGLEIDLRRREVVDGAAVAGEAFEIGAAAAAAGVGRDGGAVVARGIGASFHCWVLPWSRRGGAGARLLWIYPDGAVPGPLRFRAPPPRRLAGFDVVAPRGSFARGIVRKSRTASSAVTGTP